MKPLLPRPARPTMLSILGLLVALIYVFLWTRGAPRLEFDAMNFWMHAQDWLKGGFWEGLRHGLPPRELGYPFFLFLIDRIAPLGQALRATVAAQLLLLFLSALMSVHLLTLLGRSLRVKALCFLLVALSPALTGAALSLYAEAFAAFLFTLWLTALAETLRPTSTRRTVLFTFVSAAACSALVLTRAAYLHVALLSLLVWGFLLVRRGRPTPKRVAIAAGYFVVAFTLPLLWMVRNAKVSGVFTLADHAGIVLQGRYQKSLEPYTLRDVAAASLNAASESACRAIFKDCLRYSWVHVNTYGYSAAQAIQKELGVTTEQANQRLFHRTIRSALLEHPIRFFLFSWFEIVQLTFFETASAGSADIHSPALNAFTQSAPYRGAVHFGLSLLYAGGFIAFLLRMTKLRDPEARWIGLLIVVPVVSHFVVYSLATAVIRYSFVIAPVYIGLAMAGGSLLIGGRSRS